MSENMMFNSSFIWLIWSRKKHPNLDYINFSFDTEVTWATQERPNARIVFYDLYKINYTWPVISTYSGEWDDTNGLSYHLKEFKYLRRGDLQGLLFNAAVVVTDTPEYNIEMRLKSDINRHVDSITKYNYALNKRLSTKFNFTLQLHVTDSNGYPDETGKFDGMMGMLQRGEVQLGINSLIMGPKRLDAADFTGPTWEFRVAAIFRHPPTVGKSDSLIVPFTKQVWGCMALSWGLMAVAFQFVNWLEARRRNLPKQNMDHSWGASFLAVSGAITEQGTELESTWMTWRIVYLVTLIQAVLVNAYYGACLVSNLLQPPPKSILTVQDLLKSKLKVGYVDNRQNHDLFQEMTDPLVMQLYRQKIKSSTKSAFPFDVAISKLHREEYAIHDEATALYPIMEETFNNDDKCAITEIVLFAPTMTYCVIQKRSPYRKLFTYGLRLMMEDGIMARELATWRAEPPKCQVLDKFYIVKLETVTLAFSVFICGLFASAAILLLERFQYFKHCIKKKAA